MIVELIGCTGAGKSTIADGILKICREMKINAMSSNIFILRKSHLNRIKNYYIRTFIIDLISVLMCISVFWKHFKLYSLVLKIIQDSPSSAKNFEKLNILRNTFKQIGIYEFARRYGSVDEIILMDEGTLHTAHYLFVNEAVAPNISHFSPFVSLIPLADAIIYIKENDDILINRTLSRGHNRISENSRVMVKRFIKHAVSTFNELTQFPIVKSRLLIVNKNQQINNFQKIQNSVKDIAIGKILQSSLDLINSSYIFDKNQ